MRVAGTRRVAPMKGIAGLDMRFYRFAYYLAGAVALFFAIVGLARADEPTMVCEADCICDAAVAPDCYGCIRFTAINVGEETPRWSASVLDGKAWRDTYYVNGLSVAIPVDRRWTLVTMSLRIKGKWQAVCRYLFRRPARTGRFESMKYEAVQ